MEYKAIICQMPEDITYKNSYLFIGGNFFRPPIRTPRITDNKKGVVGTNLLRLILYGGPAQT